MSGSEHWRSNLVACLLGSFSTIAAMTMLLPYLPLYVEHLGVRGHAAIERWSGIAYAATFLTAALTAPLWGRLGDRYGRKPMLLRASLGMAIAMSLIGLAQNVEQLVLLRLLTGVLGGYSSGR
jgi:MFS family permease